MDIRKDLFSKEEIKQIKSLKTPYDDIINLPYPQSLELEHSSLVDRACQFAPFAALTGYDEKIDEAGRITNKKIVLDENKKALLDQKINYILSLKEDRPLVSISYFVKDQKKEGGKYIKKEGKIIKINPFKKTILMENNIIINAKDIIDIEILSND